MLLDYNNKEEKKRKETSRWVGTKNNKEKKRRNKHKDYVCLSNNLTFYFLCFGFLFLSFIVFSLHFSFFPPILS